MAGSLKIDSHMHIYPTKEEGQRHKAGGYSIWEYGNKTDVRFSKYGGDIEDALEAIDEGGFSKAVVVNLFTAPRVPQTAAISTNPPPREQLKEFNRWACDLAKPHPQLIPFISADPRILPGDEGAAHVRDLVENHGARGIKLHPVVQGFHMADQKMWPIYWVCQELSIPIIAHSGPARGGEPYAEPHAFVKPLEAFPNLKFVLAHLGGATWEQAPEIASSYPNAYFDCCEIMEWTGAPNAPSDRQLAQLILDVGSDRVMMGTDFPWYDLDRSAELVMGLPLLSQEEKEAILGANAARILDL